MNNPFEVIEARLRSIENLILDLKHKLDLKHEPTDQPEQLLTIQQAAELAGLTVSTMHSKVSKGELRVIERSMQLLYFSRTELLEYLKAIEQEAEALEYLKDRRKKSNVEIEAEAYLSNNKKALK